MKTIICIGIVLLSFKGASQSPPEIGKYYFVELIPNKEMRSYSKKELDSIQVGHMANIRAMAEAKKLVLAGPFQDGGGLFVLKVQDEKIAEELLKNDPAISAGRFQYKMRVWYTEKRMFTLESQ